MFDFGFTEMMVIAIVALVVIGPERLPKVARTIGAYLGRLQRYVNDVKADINRELELDELRKFKQTVEETARDFESSVKSEVSGAEAELSKLTHDVAEPFANLDTPAATDVLAPPQDGANPAIESLERATASDAGTVNSDATPPIAATTAPAIDAPVDGGEADSTAKRAA